MAGFYSVLKGRAYSIAAIATGRSNADAQASGDVYDLLMSDSDHSRQQAFLALLTDDVMPEAHRKILLDGLAKEYAGFEGWLQYVERETRQDSR
jgi:hypothetical protein